MLKNLSNIVDAFSQINNMKKTFILIICMLIIQSFLLAQLSNTKITDQTIGDVQVKKSINKLKTSHKGWVIKQDVKIINDDKKIIYKIFEGEKLILEIEPIFDRKTMRYTDKIDKITTYSSKYKTSKGISVGVTLQSALAKYTNRSIIKDSDGNLLVNNSDEYMSLIIDPKSYIGSKTKLIDGTTNFSKEDFNTTAKIIAIKIFNVPDGEINK